MSPEPVSGIDTTSGYRVYALRWHAGGTFDAWYSKGSRWTSNPSDWTCRYQRRLPSTPSPLSETRQESQETGCFWATSPTPQERGMALWTISAGPATATNSMPWSFNLSSLAPRRMSPNARLTPYLRLMGPGQQFNVSVTFTNWGNNTWTRAAGTNSERSVIPTRSALSTGWSSIPLTPSLTARARHSISR